MNEQDARFREKYLKSGMGKRYIKNRLKRFLSLTGFTLLEIVVSMLILSIVVAGAYGLFVSNYKLLTDAKHRLQAVNQAATVMEKLKSYVSADPDLPANAGEWGALKTGTNYSPQTQIGLDAVPFITDVSNPQWKYSVENVTGTDIKKVTVIVNWDEV